MAAQGKCPVNSSASVNLNVTCVENWTLTCYAVTFMIRHWRVALQVPGDLREQVSNYLYARQNASQLINYGSAFNVIMISSYTIVRSRGGSLRTIG